MSNVWFTSDTHFGHDNIIAYCNRPYTNVAEMNRDLTQRWNERVQDNDTVYHLGDFAMGDPSRWAEYSAALRGRRILVLGNHDRKGRSKRENNTDNARTVMHDVGVEDVLSNAVITIEKTRLWLNHYPGVDSYRGRASMSRPPVPGPFDVALCGHVHERWRVGVVEPGPFAESQPLVNVGVGVDVWDYRPMKYSQ